MTAVRLMQVGHAAAAGELHTAVLMFLSCLGSCLHAEGQEDLIRACQGVIIPDMRCTYACCLWLTVASLQVFETGAALTWAFFAFPTRHFDEKTPLLQACSLTPC